MVMRLPILDARIPQWKFDDLVQRACPICNTTETKESFVRPDDLTVLLCKKCKTFFVSPAPSSAQLAAFYSTYDSDHQRASSVSPVALANMYSRLKSFDDPRIQELCSLMVIKNKSVLDVGFGRAQFLYSMMKLGATPHGVDLDRKATEYAKYLGIHNVHLGSIDDLPIDVRYDIVVMNDFIEHPLAPMDLLRKAKKMLNQNGLLLIWTPNGDVAQYEDCPTTFRVDLEHMQYLTSDSIMYIANELGFRIVHLETLGFPILKGIDQSHAANSKRLTSHIKNYIKTIPGFYIINNIRLRLMHAKQNERSGIYNLFCIFQDRSL